MWVLWEQDRKGLRKAQRWWNNFSSASTLSKLNYVHVFLFFKVKMYLKETRMLMLTIHNSVISGVLKMKRKKLTSLPFLFLFYVPHHLAPGDGHWCQAVEFQTLPALLDWCCMSLQWGYYNSWLLFSISSFLCLSPWGLFNQDSIKIVELFSFLLRDLMLQPHRSPLKRLGSLP